MNITTQQLFNKTKTACAVGVALCSISGIAQSAYQVRDPAIGNSDKAENIDGTSPVTISVLANDGATADASTLALGDAPSKGSIALSGEDIIYTPNAGFSGTDTFTYRITEVDWRNSPASTTASLAGVAAKTPIANSYVDSGVEAGSSPIHDGQTTQLSGIWNSSQLANGVVGKSHAPNSTSTTIEGCNAEDANVPAISLDVVWRAERTGDSASGNMFTITSAAAPTPLGTQDIVLKSNPFAPNALEVNGSSVQTTSGNISTPGATWGFDATGKFVNITPNQFESMNVSILASTVNGKLWNVVNTTFSTTIDYSGCSLHTATVKVTVSDGIIGTEPGSETDLDEDRDGIPDVVEKSADTDGDGIPDYLDLDSDNDSITDIVEAGGVDNNNDGKVDNPTDANNDGQDDNVRLINPTDTDGDGIPNFKEVDSNGDDTMDIAETSESAADANGDGKRDNPVDNDNDGLDDALLGNKVTLYDSDSDGTPDFAEVAETSSGGGGGGGGPGIPASICNVIDLFRKKIA